MPLTESARRLVRRVRRVRRPLIALLVLVIVVLVGYLVNAAHHHDSSPRSAGVAAHAVALPGHTGSHALRAA